MTTGQRSGRPIRRPVRSRPPRTARTALVLCAVGAAIAIAVAVLPRQLTPGPRPLFQLPVPCGQTWQLSTYPGHGEYDVDMYPTEGEAWSRPVLASYAGKVTAAGVDGTLGGRTPDDPDGPPGRGGGYWVNIDHEGKWETQYLHLLEPPPVRVGQEVAQGDQIGRVGSTGNSSAPHLHYEQRQDGHKVET